MRHDHRICAGILLVLAAGMACNAAETSLEVPIEVAGRVTFAQTKVNDEGTFPFVLDTGATETVITPPVAEKAGIRAQGAGTQKKGTAKSVAVGGVMVRSLRVFVFDPPQALSLRLDQGVNYGGILGYTFLANFVTTIDYRRMRVRFDPLLPQAKTSKDISPRPRTEAHTVPFELRQRLIYAKGEVNGQGPLTFIVDTGSAEFLLKPDAANRLKLPAAPLPAYAGVQFAKVRRVALGQAEASDITAIIRALPQERQTEGTYDGIIGYPFLSNFRVTINYRDNALVLVPYGARAAGEK